MEKILLRSKFRGSLLGALVGDCCGAPFEGQLMDSGTKIVLRNNLNKLEGPYFKGKCIVKFKLLEYFVTNLVFQLLTKSTPMIRQ